LSTPNDPVSLAAWRRTVAGLYADLRALAATDPRRAAIAFRDARDRLFREDSESPIAQVARANWPGASWFPYDPAWRTVGVVRRIAQQTTFEIPLAADGVTRCTRVANVDFQLAAVRGTLALYWFEGYGGGLWLPFADASNGVSTYGGGRYLYDTIKGADIGASESEFVLDFNFAYNPSCAYDACWSCPLPPAENRLAFAVEAGERMLLPA